MSPCSASPVGSGQDRGARQVSLPLLSSSTPGSSASADPWPQEAAPTGTRGVDPRGRAVQMPALPRRRSALLPAPDAPPPRNSCRPASPLHRHLERNRRPLPPLRLPFGKFPPRPLPVPTSNAHQAALVPRTHVALAGLRRTEATWKSHRCVWVSDGNRPPSRLVGTGHTGLSHPARGGPRPGEQPLQPPRAPLRLLDTPTPWAGRP